MNKINLSNNPLAQGLWIVLSWLSGMTLHVESKYVQILVFIMILVLIMIYENALISAFRFYYLLIDNIFLLVA